MCPSGDRTKTAAMNDETLLMSNMQPQHKDLNRQPWKHLEEYSRKVIKKGMESYTYAGCGGGDKKLFNGHDNSQPLLESHIIFAQR